MHCLKHTDNQALARHWQRDLDDATQCSRETDSDDVSVATVRSSCGHKRLTRTSTALTPRWHQQVRANVASFITHDKHVWLRGAECEPWRDSDTLHLICEAKPRVKRPRSQRSRSKHQWHRNQCDCICIPFLNMKQVVAMEKLLLKRRYCSHHLLPVVSALSASTCL